MNVTNTMALLICAMPPYVSPTHPLYCLVTRVTVNNVILNVILIIGPIVCSIHTAVYFTVGQLIAVVTFFSYLSQANIELLGCIE